MDSKPFEPKSDRVELPSPNLPDTIKLLRNASLDAARVFIMVGGIRAGFNLVLKLFSTLRKGKSFRAGLLKAIFGRDVRRSCIFFSGFTFTWKFLSRLLPRVTGYRTKTTDFLSGLLAGAFILAERKDRRISFSHQLAVRGSQSLFVSLSQKDIFHVPYAGTFLFILSTSQILYSFVVHPSTLPPPLYKFMIRTAQIPHSILELNRNIIKRYPLKPDRVSDLIKGYGATTKALEVASNLPEYPLQLPCAILHPNIDSCTVTFITRFINVLRMILPVYTGLTFIPALWFRFDHICAKPKELLMKCTTGTIRSSVFLAVLVSFYQNIICQARTVSDKFGLPEWKPLYYIAGILASGPAIMIEKPSRRMELALYALPKSIDSFYQILYNKSWMFAIPHFEVMLFMVASGLVMLFFRREPETVSPLLRMVLNKLLREHKRRPNPDSPTPSEYPADPSMDLTSPPSPSPSPSTRSNRKP